MKLNVFKKLFCTNNQKLDNLREKLIKMSLMNVDKYGWSELSIKVASNELGYSNSLSSILPKGPIDLVYYTMDVWNSKLVSDLDEIKKDNKIELDEKIKKALKLRLSYEIPVINTWPQAIKMGMYPMNIQETVNKLLISIDEMCSLEENDILMESTNINISPPENIQLFSKTKRYLLLKIFIVSELHLLSDKSYNFKNTWDLVDQLYSINMTLYSSLNKFSMINSAFLTMIKYSLTAFVPYDLSKIEEIAKLKEEVIKEEKAESLKSGLNDKL
jgi:ubiquinone biosynthesis protein COQ9